MLYKKDLINHLNELKMKLEITNQGKFNQCVESYRIIDNEVEITWTDQAMEDYKDRLQCKVEYFGPSEPAGEYIDFGFSIEMTKEDVLKYISDEIESNNSILFATIGQGGAGESLYSESSRAQGLSLEGALEESIFSCSLHNNL